MTSRVTGLGICSKGAEVLDQLGDEQGTGADECGYGEGNTNGNEHECSGAPWRPAARGRIEPADAPPEHGSNGERTSAADAWASAGTMRIRVEGARAQVRDGAEDLLIRHF